MLNLFLMNYTKSRISPPLHPHRTTLMWGREEGCKLMASPSSCVGDQKLELEREIKIWKIFKLGVGEEKKWRVERSSYLMVVPGVQNGEWKVEGSGNLYQGHFTHFSLKNTSGFSSNLISKQMNTWSGKMNPLSPHHQKSKPLDLSPNFLLFLFSFILTQLVIYNVEFSIKL